VSETTEDGVEQIYGDKGGQTELKRLVFPKPKWSAKRVAKWLRSRPRPESD
jgi:hypothetical protein